MQQSINRLDHIAFLVRPENIYKFKQQFSDTLGVKWDEEVVYEKAGMVAIPAWDAGIELVAPLQESGNFGNVSRSMARGAARSSLACAILMAPYSELRTMVARSCSISNSMATSPG